MAAATWTATTAARLYASTACNVSSCFARSLAGATQSGNGSTPKYTIGKPAAEL